MTAMPRFPRIGRRDHGADAPADGGPEGQTTAMPAAVASSGEAPTLEAAAVVDPAAGAPAPAPVGEPVPAAPPKPDRSRMRRRLRYLRHARELAYRDLGGLMFELWRFGRSRDDLVLAKLQRLSEIETEIVSLEVALEEPGDVLVVHEPGVAACPNCGELHGTGANFCPNCGWPFGAAAAAVPAPAAPAPVPAPAAQAPAPPGAPPPAAPPETATAYGAGTAEQPTAPVPPASEPTPPAAAPDSSPPAEPPPAPGGPGGPPQP